METKNIEKSSSAFYLNTIQKAGKCNMMFC